MSYAAGRFPMRFFEGIRFEWFRSQPNVYREFCAAATLRESMDYIAVEWARRVVRKHFG